MTSWTISKLSQVPHFADAVALRGWTAWWTESGEPLAEYRKYLTPMLEADADEQGFVAHAGGTYLGSALLIENDLDVRPAYKPWMAALWVDEPYRRRGIAAALMDMARQQAAFQGWAKIYLCAVPAASPYYLQRGWNLIEANVSGLNVFENQTR